MKYTALFRGINVGGKNIVKMADLKKLFAELGFENVRAYIQSGNIIFAAEGEPGVVTDTIRAGFKAAFGFESALTLRTGDEMAAIIRDLPFSPEEIAAAQASNPDVAHLYVYLTEDAPDTAEIERLVCGYAGTDILRSGRREIYLLCHQSVRDSKLAAALGKLDKPMTARNWKTMCKLCEMLETNA